MCKTEGGAEMQHFCCKCCISALMGADMQHFACGAVK